MPIYKSGKDSVFEFTPTIFKLLPNSCCGLENEPHIKLRFFYRFLIGYRLYLLKENNETIAYCMFQKGKIYRYPFVKKHDLLMGPYFVSEGHRNVGNAKKLLNSALIYLKDKGVYESVYAWIVADNEPSKHVVGQIGFKQCAWLDTSKLRKKISDKATKHGLWKLNLIRFTGQEK